MRRPTQAIPAGSVVRFDPAAGSQVRGDRGENVVVAQQAARVHRRNREHRHARQVAGVEGVGVVAMEVA